MPPNPMGAAGCGRASAFDHGPLNTRFSGLVGRNVSTFLPAVNDRTPIGPRSNASP